MVSKDQAIGVGIFVLCALAGILYVLTLAWPQWLGLLAISESDLNIRIWAIAIPILIAFVAIVGIGAWIGWTMATTPPPKPIEELTSEIEGKKEEPAPEPEKPEEEKKTEKPERKRKEEKPQ